MTDSETVQKKKQGIYYTIVTFPQTLMSHDAFAKPLIDGDISIRNVDESQIR